MGAIFDTKSRAVKPNEIVQLLFRLELKPKFACNHGQPLKNFTTRKDVCP